MFIQVDDHAFVDELCAHFTRSGFGAEPVGGGMVGVSRPDAPSEEQQRREVILHLQLWNVLNPDAAAEVVP